MAISGISLKDYAKTGGTYDPATGLFVDPNGYVYDPASQTWMDPSGAAVSGAKGYVAPWDTGTPQIPGMGGTRRTPEMDARSAQYKALPDDLKAAMRNLGTSREHGNFLTHSVLPAAALFAGGVALGGVGAGAGAAGAAGPAATTYPLATAPAASALSGSGVATVGGGAGAAGAAGAGGLGGAGLGGSAAVPAGGANLGGASLGYSTTAAGAPLGGAAKGASVNWRKIISQAMRQQSETPAQPNAAQGDIARALGAAPQWTPDRMRQIGGETVEQAAARRKRREIADAMVMQIATGGGTPAYG